jgi:hypothetical protein
MQAINAPFVETYHAEGGAYAPIARHKLLYLPKLLELAVRMLPNILLGLLAVLLQPNNQTGKWSRLRTWVFKKIGFIILLPFALLKELTLPLTSPINHVLKPLIVQFRKSQYGRLTVVVLGAILLAGAAATLIFGGAFGLTLPAMLVSLPVVGGLLLGAGSLPLWAGVLVVVGVGYLGMAISHRMSFNENQFVVTLSDARGYQNIPGASGDEDSSLQSDNLDSFANEIDEEEGLDLLDLRSSHRVDNVTSSSSFMPISDLSLGVLIAPAQTFNHNIRLREEGRANDWDSTL